MVKVHTAQLNVGKKVAKNSNVLFLDTTAKSSNSEIEKALAPSWELVTAYKSGTNMSDSKYALEYLRQLNTLEDHIVKWFESLAEGRFGFTEIIISCYCGKDKFCHRHLLQRWLINKFTKLEEGWEVLSSDISERCKPNGSILSIVESDFIKEEDVSKLFQSEIENGEIVVVNDNYVIDLCKSNGKVFDPETDCTLERATANWLAITNITKHTKGNNSEKRITYIDASGFTSELLDQDTPKSELGEMIQGYVNSRAVWKTLKVEPEHSLRDLVYRFGYVTELTISNSHKNVDHASCMDVLYESNM